MVQGTRTVCSRRIGSDRGGQGGGNGVEFPSSVRLGPVAAGASETSSRRPTERTQAAAPTERTRRDLRSRTNPRARLISTIRLLAAPVRGALRVAARPCSARRRIPTIPCGRAWPAMANEGLTPGIGSAAAFLGREDSMPEPERMTLARSRHASGGHRNGSDRGGQRGGNGVEFPSPVEPRPVAVGQSENSRRRATERTQALRQPNQPDVTGEAERTQDFV